MSGTSRPHSGREGGSGGGGGSAKRARSENASTAAVAESGADDGTTEVSESRRGKSPKFYLEKKTKNDLIDWLVYNNYPKSASKDAMKAVSKANQKKFAKRLAKMLVRQQPDTVAGSTKIFYTMMKPPHDLIQYDISFALTIVEEYDGFHGARRADSLEWGDEADDDEQHNIMIFENEIMKIDKSQKPTLEAIKVELDASGNPIKAAASTPGKTPKGKKGGKTIKDCHSRLDGIEKTLATTHSTLETTDADVEVIREDVKTIKKDIKEIKTMLQNIAEKLNTTTSGSQNDDDDDDDPDGTGGRNDGGDDDSENDDDDDDDEDDEEDDDDDDDDEDDDDDDDDDDDAVEDEAAKRVRLIALKANKAAADASTTRKANLAVQQVRLDAADESSEDESVRLNQLVSKPSKVRSSSTSEPANEVVLRVEEETDYTSVRAASDRNAARQEKASEQGLVAAPTHVTATQRGKKLAQPRPIPKKKRTESDDEIEIMTPGLEPKRKKPRGRPKGSKNKPKEQ